MPILVRRAVASWVGSRVMFNVYLLPNSCPLCALRAGTGRPVCAVRCGPTPPSGGSTPAGGSTLWFVCVCEIRACVLVSRERGHILSTLPLLKVRPPRATRVPNCFRDDGRWHSYEDQTQRGGGFGATASVSGRVFCTHFAITLYGMIYCVAAQSQQSAGEHAKTYTRTTLKAKYAIGKPVYVFVLCVVCVVACVRAFVRWREIVVRSEEEAGVFARHARIRIHLLELADAKLVCVCVCFVSLYLGARTLGGG